MPTLHVKDWVPSLSPPATFSGAHIWAECCEESRAPLLASLLLSLKPAQRRALIITPTVERAVQWHGRLALFGFPESRLHLLNPFQTSLYDDMPPDPQTLSDRVAALAALASGTGVVIAVPQAALELCPPRKRFAGATIRLSTESDLRNSLPQAQVPHQADAVESLLRALVRIGYEHEDPVRRPGAFSRRGGILDVFPFGAPLPARIEFFGEQVESIRAFDVETQRSTTILNSLHIPPGRLIDSREGAEAVANVTKRLSSLPEAERKRLSEALADDLMSLQEGVPFDRLELYLPALRQRSTILDYVSEALLVIDDPMEVEVFADRAMEDLSAALASRLHRSEVPPFAPHEYLGSLDAAQRVRWRIALTSSNFAPSWFGAALSHVIGTQSLAPYRGRAQALAEAIVNWGDQGALV
ncbi:MAG: hypothetical protein C4342_06500, partial [Armatimonadota bacterium]